MKKIEQVQVKGYYFTGVPDLFWHSGKFWMHEKEVKQVYNNGSMSLLLYGGSKKSIKQLRKQAHACTITIYNQPLPF